MVTLPLSLIFGALAVDAHFHRQFITPGVGGMHQAPGLQLLAHRTGRQEGQPVAFERHRLEALGHVGLVDGLQRQGHAGLLHHRSPPAGPGRRRRHSQEGHALARPAGQAELRLALGVGSREGCQRLLAQGQHLVAGRVELQGLAGVVIGQHQVAMALGQLQHGVVHIEGTQPAS
jgi:catechol 2,3-dioxygenase-like lactoylglutathione lyase family enzyme